MAATKMEYYRKDHHKRQLQTRRLSLTAMIFPGRGHRGSSAAAAERDRAAREEANQQSWLLKLPAELRVRIYELTTPRGRNFGICANKDFVDQCPLLAVCRQTQREVMPVFFGSNTFMILLRSLTKRHWRKKSHSNFTEDAFSYLRNFQLVNNFLCRVGRQKLPHCLHLDGVVVEVDRNSEVVETCKPICSSGINLPSNNAPRPFADSDDHPCFSACCLKSRKVAEERLVKEVETACLQFKHRKLQRQDLVEVGTLSLRTNGYECILCSSSIII